MSAQPLLPPRGVFVPTHMIFDHQLPSAVVVTWIQLRGLAWRGWSTPPLSLAELASLTGIHPARLHRHLSQLRETSMLSWVIKGDGKMVVSFPNETRPQKKASEESSMLAISDENTHKQDKVNKLADYFPQQILGYLSWADDPLDATDEEAYAWEVPAQGSRAETRNEHEKAYVLRRDCAAIQHIKRP